MKLFTKLFILSAAVTALSGCRSDLLDTVPYDKAASNSIWTNENFCELGVAGVYSELREDYVAKRAYELEAFCVSGSCRDNDYPILAGTASIGSGLFSDYWRQHYEGIQRANDAYFQKLFEQRFEKCPNKVSAMLENLTDETCERLNLALNDVVPVKQRLYRDTSIFQEADADKVSKSILGLSNESRNTFLHFLQSRYKYTSYGTEIEYLNECCQSDLPQLKLINEKLKTEAATRRLIEKYSIEKITNLIDEITAKVK